MSTDQHQASWIGPNIAAALFLLACLSVAVWWAVVLPERPPILWFPADHGVAVTDDPGIRCAAETIEANPEPFSAEHGFLIERGTPNEFVVRTTWRTTPILMTEGRLSYQGSFRDWHTVAMDCPRVGVP